MQNILLPKLIKIKCGIIEHWVWPLLESFFPSGSILFLFNNTSEVISLHKHLEAQRADQGIVQSLNWLRTQRTARKIWIYTSVYKMWCRTSPFWFHLINCDLGKLNCNLIHFHHRESRCLNFPNLSIWRVTQFEI